MQINTYINAPKTSGSQQRIYWDLPLNNDHLYVVPQHSKDSMVFLRNNDTVRYSMLNCCQIPSLTAIYEHCFPISNYTSVERKPTQGQNAA